MLALQHALGCSCRITALAPAPSTPDALAATRLLPNASPQAAAAAKPRTRAQAPNAAHK